jgi:putative membrane protein
MKLKPFLALSIMLVAAGCENDDNNRTDRDNMYDSGSRTNTTTHTTTSGTTPAANLAQADRDFVKDAASGGMFEVQSSQVALQQPGVDPKVMRIAQMMVEDHTRANQELQVIATRKGITLSQQLSPEHEQMLDRLRSASNTGASGGYDFNNQYFTMQTQAHQDAIALFQRASQSLSDPDLRQYAQRTLAVLHQHLQHIQQHAPVGATGGRTVPMREPANQPVPPRTPPYPDAEDTVPDESPIPPNSPR